MHKKATKILKVSLVVLTLGLFLFFFQNIVLNLSVQAQTSSDAIAIRVIPNLEHKSVLRWYFDQGFTGSPQTVIVDGYEGIRDGRTVYVNAANIVNPEAELPDMHTNIYLISYNQDVEQATINIVNQIIDHWKFNTNLLDRRGQTFSGLPARCIKDGAAVNDIVCLTDADCREQGSYCTSAKAQVVRDTLRMARLNDIKYLLEQYQANHNGQYPTLSAGTYVSNSTISVWPSWQETLGQALGTSLPIDPVNKLAPCGEGFDQITCWDEVNKSFAYSAALGGAEWSGNNNIFVYTISGNEYELCAISETELIEDRCASECNPQCWGRNCGADGCGGVCGQCIGDQICVNGRCEGVCNDNDGDGYGEGSGCDGPDCNDNDEDINPEANEICGNGIDENCDGIDDPCACPDNDSDGYTDSACGGTDCNDDDNTINPGAVEVCDGVDNNCANGADEGGVCPIVTYYCDNDSDTYYDATADGTCNTYNCTPAGCQAAQGDDCNDANADIYPGADEICGNGVDENCDGVDDPCACPDNDNDGYADSACGGTDCNDSNDTINPGAFEVCDDSDTDENCNGLADDNDPGATGQTIYYIDSDSDNYGSESDTGTGYCDPPAGVVTDNTDCNDGDLSINPGAEEECGNGIDENCDGDDSCPCITIQKRGIYYEEEGFDLENDSGDTACCEDNTYCVDGGTCYASGTCRDIDSDGDEEYCNSAFNRWEEVDSYGFGDLSGTYPSSTWRSYCDNCVGAGRWNLGGEAVSPVICVNCWDFCCGDDANEFVKTNAAETQTRCCDRDTDCVNSAGTCIANGADCGGGEGVCNGVVCGIVCPDNDSDGYTNSTCGGSDCNDSDEEIYPGATEVCDGVDNNCANGVDEGGVCSSVTYYCDKDSDTYYNATADGTCNTYSCTPAGCQEAQGDDCNDSNPAINPGATEVCGNAVDEDCSGAADPCPCGNGNLDSGEECDDGNTTGGDGCNADCTRPDTCNAVCTAAIGCDGYECFGNRCRNPSCTAETDCVCCLNEVTLNPISNWTIFAWPAGVNRFLLYNNNIDYSQILSFSSGASDVISVVLDINPLPVSRTLTVGWNSYLSAWRITGNIDIPGDYTVTVTANSDCDSDTTSFTLTVIPNQWCGDGIITGLEDCDDGNTTDGDGCNTSSNNCKYTCGDGHINTDGGEVCDDGDDDNFDECDNNCQETYCGDGIIQTPNSSGLNEQCDGGADCTNCRGPCSAPWHEFTNGECLLWNSTGSRYADAVQICINNGGTLATADELDNLDCNELDAFVGDLVIRVADVYVGSPDPSNPEHMAYLTTSYTHDNCPGIVLSCGRQIFSFIYGGAGCDLVDLWVLNNQTADNASFICIY